MPLLWVMTGRLSQCFPISGLSAPQDGPDAAEVVATASAEPVRRRHHRTALGAEPALVDHAASLALGRLNWFGRTGPGRLFDSSGSCPLDVAQAELYAEARRIARLKHSL